jgi:uncharacterized DUF497 family protein
MRGATASIALPSCHRRTSRALSLNHDATRQRRHLRKHGVRFSDAEAVLLDPHANSLDDPTDEERRFVSTGLDVIGRIVVVVDTYRGDDVRRSIRDAERETAR